MKRYLAGVMMVSLFYLAAFMALTMLASNAAAQGSPAMDMQSLILRADLNGDGVVAREEFLQTRSEAFGQIDADQSGSLNEAEFAAVMPGERARRFAGRAFVEVDGDQDGSITQAEWDASPTRLFDRADRNNDDSLSREELTRTRR